MPTLTCGSAITAVSAITITSHSSAIDAPSPIAGPLTAATIGSSTSSRSQISCLASRRSWSSVSSVPQLREPGEVAAGGERPLRTGEEDGPRRALPLQQPEQLAELVVQRRVDGVQVVAGAVDRGDEHVALSIEANGLERLHCLTVGQGARTVAAVRLSIVLGEWLDRPVAADLEVAELADQLGYPEVWIGEMAKVDAPGAGGNDRQPHDGDRAVPRAARSDRSQPDPDRARRSRPSPPADGPATSRWARRARRWRVGTARHRTGAADRLARATADVQALLPASG